MFKKVLNEKIKKQFDRAKKIALFGHVNPDGDCIGAMLGLGRLLEKQGKKVYYFTPTGPSKVFNFLKGINKIKKIFDYDKYDLLVFVDFGGYNRIMDFTKGKEKYFDKSNTVVIDHHPSDLVTNNSGVSIPRQVSGDNRDHSQVIIDEEVMSTSELVFENAIQWRPKFFDSLIATYFYMGLTIDSGNFLYDVDHERILNNALNLVKLGADKSLIIDKLVRRQSLDVIKFTGLVLDRIKQKGVLLYSYYSDADMKKYNIDQEEASFPLMIIQNIDGPKLVLMIKKVDDQIRGSLRSKNIQGELRSKAIDCNTIARKFGGGGHKLASGFSQKLNGDFLKQIDKITTIISRLADLSAGRQG